MTQPAENQQQSITADSHLFPKQHATLVDKIWYWQTVTAKIVVTWCEREREVTFAEKRNGS